MENAAKCQSQEHHLKKTHCRAAIEWNRTSSSCRVTRSNFRWAPWQSDHTPSTLRYLCNAYNVVEATFIDVFGLVTRFGCVLSSVFFPVSYGGRFRRGFSRHHRAILQRLCLDLSNIPRCHSFECVWSRVEAARCSNCLE